MGPRRFTRLQKAAALGPLFLLMLMTPGQDLLRCQFDGLLRASCCCPVAKTAPGGDATPVVKGQGCCDRVASTAPRPAPAEATTGTGTQVDALVVHAVVSRGPFVAAPPARALIARQSHGPPQGGPPILLQKSTLLI